MRIDIVKPADLAPADLAAWRAFQAADPDLQSPFLTPEWAAAADAAPGPDQGRVRVAVWRDGAGAAQAFLAARVGRFTALAVGAPLSDYMGVVARAGVTPDVAQAVRAWGVGRLDLANALADQPALGPHLRCREASRLVDISEGFEAYAAARKAAGGGVLQDCAKKRRKLERDHGAVVFTPEDKDPAALEVLLDWKRSQLKATGQTDMLAGWTGARLRALWTAEDPALHAPLFTLRVDGRLAATHLALRSHGALHAWFIAHDEAFARYSPGVLLIEDMLRWAGGAGVRELDFGPGEYQFKLRLANRERAVGSGFVGRPASPAAAVRRLAYGLRETAERLPLGRASAWPAKAMRRIDLWRGLGAFG